MRKQMDSEVDDDDDANSKKSWESQAKAPRKGVKADDEDEYQAKGSFYDKSVGKSKAYADQEKAPKGRGSRGPSQADGGPIKGWDISVNKGDAYKNQECWSQGSEKASLGFKISGNSGYLGHMAGEDVLRKGHNDSGSISDFMFGTGSGDSAASQSKPAMDPMPKKQSGDEDEPASDGQSSMRQAFKYKGKGKLY